MASTYGIRKFDNLGRIVIPKELRKQLFGTKNTEGMPMEIFMDKDNIILRKYEENKTDDVCEWEYDKHFAILQKANVVQWILTESNLRN